MHPLISPISQLAQGTNPSAVPLVLIHDGGGTVSSYRALGPLDCDIYAISDPRFEDGLSWEGGIREMARTYLGLIRETIPSRKVLLGGWSFGGLIVVEIANLIEEEDDLCIAGLILIDAPYATFSERPLHEVIYGDMPDLPGLSPRLRRGIWASIQRARGMILEWQQSANLEDLQSQKRLPPAVLLRGTEFVKTADRSVAVVDTCRHDTKLGWNQYGTDFIDLVWNVPGSHYSLFESRNIRYLNERVASACAYLLAKSAAVSEAGTKSQDKIEDKVVIQSELDPDTGSDSGISDMNGVSLAEDKEVSRICPSLDIEDLNLDSVCSCSVKCEHGKVREGEILPMQVVA